MRILGFVPIHYGVEYLPLCLSVLNEFCDMVYVSYTSEPSHGSQAIAGGKKVTCPDTKEQIRAISQDVLGNKLIWEEFKSFACESHHRNTVFKHSAGYDVVVSADSDEVFDKDTFMDGVKMAFESPHRYNGTMNFINFWRSFNYIVKDGFSPIRFTNLHRSGGVGHGLPAKIYHFGTCQRRDIMEYKYLCHGHKSELRSDWLSQVYYKWTEDNQIENLHPVANGIWKAEKIDKDLLPEYIKAHPNFLKELV